MTDAPHVRRRLPLLAFLLAAAVLITASVMVTRWNRPAPRAESRVASVQTFDASTAPFAAAEDWPRWRGPRGDGISRENLPDTLPDTGPTRLWSAEVGEGYSSPVAHAGRVYLFTLSARHEVLTCFDADSGRILWSDASDGAMWSGSYPGTRATPVIDGDAIYTYGGAGELVARDLASGKPRWKLHVLKTTGSRNMGWGTASSPLLVGDNIVVQSGKDKAVALAVRKTDGQVAWQSEARGNGGYAHPVLADVNGKPQLVVFAGEGPVGMDPDTGKTLWTEAWKTSYDVNASTPIYRDGHLLVTSEYGRGAMMLKLDGNGATKLWESKEVQSKFPGTVLDGDALYANSSGTIKCMHWPDGKILWEARDPKLRLGAGGSIVRAGDKLLTMSERGKLSLAKATPAGIELLSQADLFDGSDVWSTPLVYGGRLYAKGVSEFVCFDLSGKIAPTTREVAQTQETTH